jgi:hypothetical protein
MAEGAPAVGGILLDPAVLGIDLPRFLRQITTPVMLLGADEHVAMARNRDYFYRFVRTGIAEVSIKDASHEDAQYPADSGAVTEELQVSFVSAITSAAFSFATNGNLEYAWSSFADDFKNGNFFNAKRK